MSDVWLWFGADAESPTPPEISFDVTDNPVVDVLLGPDGEPLLVVLRRPQIKFGFTR